MRNDMIPTFKEIASKSTLMICSLLLLIFYQGTPLAAQDDSHSYVGVRKCRVCHRSEDKGNQFGAWNETAHAKALEALSTESALDTAKERDLALPPSQAPECLECHVTGWGQPGGYEILTEEFMADEANAKAVKLNKSLANVGCEMCHGPGSAYKSKKTMQGIFDGTIDPVAVGLRKVTEKVCKTCHNERSPQYKEFNFEVMFAKIAHPYPEGLRP